jgi:hypothetical protein
VADIKLAKAVEVKRIEGGGVLVSVDGEPFPWLISADGIALEVDPKGCYVLRLGILVDLDMAVEVGEPW